MQLAQAEAEDELDAASYPAAHAASAQATAIRLGTDARRGRAWHGKRGARVTVAHAEGAHLADTHTHSEGEVGAAALAAQLAWEEEQLVREEEALRREQQLAREEEALQ